MQHTIKEGETNSTLFLSGEIDMSNADSIKDIAIGLIKKKGDSKINMFPLEHFFFKLVRILAWIEMVSIIYLINQIMPYY